MASSMLALYLQLILGSSFCYLWASYLLSPLRHVPGPFLAKFTNLWRLLNVLGRKAEFAERLLHDKYGPVVRIGPNMVSVGDPALLPQVYSRKDVWIKGDFYKVSDMNVNGRRVENIFSTRNEHMNSQILRPVTKLYSMGQMVKLEPLIDSAIECFLEQLTERFARTDTVCDMDRWLLYCALDVLSDATFSERFGFMEQGRDVLGLIATNHAAMNYVSVVGVMPWLDMCLERNPIKRIGPPAYGPVIGFGMHHIAGRLSGQDGHDKSKPDMLDGFIEAMEAASMEVRGDVVLSYVFANLAAGSDTVAAELRSVIYHLCKNPKAMERLQAELDEAEISSPVSWSRCLELPYLCACMSEGFRISPGVVMPLERRVGPSGMALPDGKTVLPPGTIVGANPYVINRDRDVYGPDAHCYRPERWLQGPDETLQIYEDRLSRMKAADLTFGAGKRVCVGRNLALIESHKVVASLVHTFDIALVDPEKEWKTHSAWIVQQSDIKVKLKRRIKNRSL